MKLTTHLHLVLRSKNEWSYTSTPQYAFMAWCSVKAQLPAPIHVLCFSHPSYISNPLYSPLQTAMQFLYSTLPFTLLSMSTFLSTMTVQVALGGHVTGLYSVDTLSEYQLWHQLSWLRFSVFSKSPCTLNVSSHSMLHNFCRHHYIHKLWTIFISCFQIHEIYN
jgi:hypothetical protein